MTNSNKIPNGLEKEKSPYLLQHAYNPVNWYPWGKEAFEKAQKEQKPVFLSIGYSTCHWCHVMAHESFEDPEVAALLNEYFISIKVDREERPDVDAVYMAVCQAMTGSGGWPMTILMTAEQKPFWAGTYLPKTGTMQMIGLMDLLGAIIQQWKTDREKLLSAGDQVAGFLKESREPQAYEGSAKDLLQKGVEQFRRIYDIRWGGFGRAPKFPSAHNLSFLLRYSILEKDSDLQEMVEHTLIQMYRGGMFDHVGGGFSRYSTDQKWLVPHFEKMLYDNALLADAYLEAFRITKKPLYRHVAEQVLDYVLRELTDEKGGFYCGQDADSDGVEGKYYVFTPQELETVLGAKDSEEFCRWFGITEAGNFEGKNIPNLIQNQQYGEENQHIQILCEKLRAYRIERTRLHKDDKVLASWNSLMIASFAKAAQILNRADYGQAARKAQRFIADSMTNSDGRLLLRWREEEAAHAGQLDDYAFYALALLELYQTDYDEKDLALALQTAQHMMDWFWDDENSGFYLYAKDSEQLISRPKEVYDGAMPSGNAVAALVLQRLFHLTGEIAWKQAAEQQMRFLSAAMQEYPAGHSVSLRAFMEEVYPSRQLVCVTGDKQIPSEIKGIDAFHFSVLVKTKSNEQELSLLAPFVQEYPIPEPNQVRYYLCQNGACLPPVDSIDELKKLLQS